MQPRRRNGQETLPSDRELQAGAVPPRQGGEQEVSCLFLLGWSTLAHARRRSPHA